MKGKRHLSSTRHELQSCAKGFFEDAEGEK